LTMPNQGIKEARIRGGSFYVYMVINYRDIYNDDRESGYYAKLFGGMVPQAPSPEHDKKYNYWEKPKNSP